MQNSDPSSIPGEMFTSCPNCLKQFRIQPAQLSTADDRVICGVCKHIFNALSRLSDVPLTPDQMSCKFAHEPAQNLVSEAGLDEEPEFDIPVSTHEKEKEAKSDKEGLLSEFPDQILGDIPDELREEIPAKRGLLATISLAIGTILLLLTIILQLTWFNRDELLLRYPQFVPVARDICDRLQCEIPRHKDISAIKLLNRDVRNHPVYEGSLLVNATMTNKSESTQPFPRIQLALFNTGGKVIGYREFKPKEYLDDSIDIAVGMRPESLIHFVLEVAGPTEDAVSFEFHFL